MIFFFRNNTKKKKFENFKWQKIIKKCQNDLEVLPRLKHTNILCVIDASFKSLY